MHKQRHHSQRKDHNNRKRHRNAQNGNTKSSKNTQYPPSHNNDTIKKDHHRPKAYSSNQFLTEMHPSDNTIQRNITTGKSTEMDKMATRNPQKTHNTPPHTIITPQKKTIIALINSSFKALTEMHKHRHHSKTDLNNSKRTQMHKITTTNLKNTQYPPSHNNHTTKKRPSSP